jgi:hypothetical protein
MKNTGVLKNINLKSIYLDGFDITSYDLDIMFNLNHIEKIRFGEVNIKQDTILMLKSENIKLLDTLNRNKTIKYKIKYDTKDDDHNIIMSFDGEILFKIIVSKTTKMKKIFDMFTEQYGLGYKFYINHKKIKDSDTLEILGMEDDEVLIEILEEDAESPKKSSKKSRNSSPRTRTSRNSSPRTRTSRNSSPRTRTSRNSSPRTRTSRKSPKTSRSS